MSRQWYEIAVTFTASNGITGVTRGYVTSRKAINERVTNIKAWLANKGHTFNTLTVTPCDNPNK
jgi:hypothetical protein